jgi:DNA repair exonuclease SbcCD ATPase subunit
MSESLPSDVYQSIGDEIGDLLQQAHDWAERTRAEAKSEADRVTEEASEAAKRLVDEAETKAETLRSQAEEAAERVQSEAADKAEQLRVDSEEKAERLKSESEKRAERLNSESEKSATKLRMSAEAYASKVRADAGADAERRMQEADARVAELREIETQARERIDALMRRLLSIAEQLGADVEGDDVADGPTELNVSNLAETQSEPTPDELRVEVVHQDEREPIEIESEQLATEGTKA